MIFRVVGLLSASLIASCQTTAAAELTPAILVSDDAASMEAVKTTLAKAMNKGSIKLGVGDLTQSSTISVFPQPSRLPVGAPQNQAGNFALPTRFNLMMDGQGCYFVKDGTDIKTPLKGVTYGSASTP